MTETIIHDDDTCTIIETCSDGWPDVAGSTRTLRTDWKPGHEPAVDPQPVTIDQATVDQVKAQLAKATTVTGVKNALGPLLDALGTA